MIADVDAAWAAGFIDGEGSLAISVTSNGTFNIYVVAGNTDPRPLLKLKELFGGRVVNRTSRIANHRDHYVWTLTGKHNLLAFLDAVEPYLVVKGEQAVLLKEACQLLRGRGKKISTDEMRLRIVASEKMHGLNRRGVG